MRRIGLLRIPEEMQPPSVLVRAAALYRQEAGEPDADDVTVLLRDPALLAAHRQIAAEFGNQADKVVAEALARRQSQAQLRC